MHLGSYLWTPLTGVSWVYIGMVIIMGIVGSSSDIRMAQCTDYIRYIMRSKGHHIVNYVDDLLGLEN